MCKAARCDPSPSLTPLRVAPLVETAGSREPGRHSCYVKAGADRMTCSGMGSQWLEMVLNKHIVDFQFASDWLFTMVLFPSRMQ